MSSYNINLGTINPCLNYNECSLVSFKVVFKKAYNFTKYATIIELLANMNDGKEATKVAIVSKIFCVEDFDKPRNALVNWEVDFNDVVAAIPLIYNNHVDFTIKVIGINAVEALGYRRYDKK